MVTLVGACCLLVLSVTVALAADSTQRSAVAGEARSTSSLVRARQKFARLQSQRRTPAARAQRRRSRSAFTHLGGAEAVRLGTHTFPTALASPPYQGLSLDQGERIERYLGRFAARIDNPGKQPDAIAEATVPLRAKANNGRMAPVDLRLERHGNAWTSRNPVVRVDYAKDPRKGVLMPGVGVAVSLHGVRSGAIGQAKSGRLVVPNALTDTDLWSRPIPGGFETFATLRSAASPERLAFDLDLPKGAQLKPGPGGTAKVTRRGQQLLSVSPALATDADGTSVPVSMSVRGSQLEIDVPHRGRDLHYPILVDPQYRTEIWTWAQDAEEGEGLADEGWYPATNHSGAFDAIALDLPGRWGGGLYTFTHEKATVNAGDYSDWRLSAPGTTTKIYRTELEYSADALNGCWEAGISGGGQTISGCVDVDHEYVVRCAHTLCDPNGGTADNYVYFRLTSSTTGERNNANKLIGDIGYADVRYSDSDLPAFVGVNTGGSGEKWVQSYNGEVTGLTRDDGVGIVANEVADSGSAWADGQEIPCEGTTRDPCPRDVGTNYPVRSEFLGDGKHTFAVNAWDALGQSSTMSWGKLWLDREGPDIEGISGTLWDKSDKPNKEGKPQATPTTLASGSYTLKIPAIDGVAGNPATERSGVKSVEIKVDGEIALPPDSQICPANCSDTREWTLQTSEYPGGQRTVSVIAKDLAGNQTIKNIHVIVPPSGTLEAPAGNTKTSRWLQLKAHADSASYTTVRFQAKKAGSIWSDIPLEALAASNGQPLGSKEQPLTSSTSPLVNWELPKTFTPPLSGEAQLQVRAMFTGPGVTGSSQPVRVTLEPKGIGTDDARTGIGPGEVNLATGNLNLSASDAAVESWATGISVSRAFNSRDPGVSANGPFGPGWTLSVPVGAGSEYASLTEVADAYGGEFVELKTTGGERIFFYLEAGKYVPETGYETMSLTKPGAGEFKLTDDDGNTVVFKKEAGTTGNLYVPKEVQEPGSTNKSSVEYEVVGGTPRVKSVLAPVPAGVTCTAPSFNTAGCRSLKLVYAASTTATSTEEAGWGNYKDRVEKVEFTAYDPATSAMKTDVVSQYLYDSNGRLRAQWDPRISPALKQKYSYDAGGRISTITPPGENAWTFTYAEISGDGDGGRLKSVSRSTPQGTATTTVVYQVPLSGASAPYKLAPNDVAVWDQKDVPVGATAVFPPDSVPANPPTSYTRATVHYLNYSGREVNTAAAGAGISTSEYDIYGNSVRELSAANRQRAIEAGAESVAVAQKLDIERTYANKGTEMTEELGPEHQVKLAGGETAKARSRTTISYDEGAPAEKDPHLPTTTTVQAKVTGGSSSVEPRVTKTEYDWTLLKPTKTIRDYGGLNLTENTTYTSTGQVESTYKPKFPKPAGGVGNPDRVSTYYKATGSGLCQGKPQFANLLCGTLLYASGEDAPVTVYDYNRLNQATTKTEEMGPRTRTTTTTYDAAGRQSTYRVAASSDNDGLVAAYGFEETSGTTATDKSGSGNTGTLEGVTRVTNGRFGRALDFDSASDKVTVPDSTSLHISNMGSMEAWVRPDASETLQKVVEKAGTVCTSPAFSLSASISASWPAPQAITCGQSINAAASNKLPTGMWSHLAMTTDNVNSSWETKIYVNGELIASGHPNAGVGWSTAAMLIGPGFDGLIDEVRIYNRALTQAEIRSDMGIAVDTGAVPPTYSKRSGLLAAYAFEDLGKTTAMTDSSGNGYNGVLSDDELRTPGGRAGQGLDPGAKWGENASVTFSSPLKVASAMTMEMWVTPSTKPEAGQYLMVLGETFALRTSFEGGLAVDVGNAHSETFYEVMSPTKAHFIAVTFGANAYKLYVDGLLRLSGTVTAGTTKDAEQLYVGLIPGRTDEVRIYNKALTLAETQEDAALPIIAAPSTVNDGTKLPLVTTNYNSSTGRPTTLSMMEGVTTRTLITTYDTVGRVTSYKDADNISATTKYDIDGRVTETSDGKGSQVYGYDSETGRLSSLVDSQAGTFTAGYDTTGQLVSQTYPGGMKAATTYDETGTPTRLVYSQPGCGACVWYEQNITESIRGQWMTNNTTIANHSYTYDGAGRLTLAKETPAGKGCTTREYVYDADSNRLSKTTRAPGEGGACVTSGSGTVQASSYANSDRITGSGFVYDPWGRLTQVPASHSGGGTLSMTYYTNDMTRTSTQDGKTVGWLLDPTQTRTRATITSENKQTIYHYSDASDAPSWTANFTGASLTSWQRNVTAIDGTLGALVNYNGTTTTPTLQLTNLHGDVVGTATTSPEATKPTELFESEEFGVPVGTSGTREYGWLGAKERRTTQTSGLIQMGVRSYVPAMGRFTSTDPVYGGSANAYDYAAQDPINAFDLDGEAIICGKYRGEVQINKLDLLPDVGTVGIEGEACRDTVRKTVSYRPMPGVEGGFRTWQDVGGLRGTLYNTNVTWEQRMIRRTPYGGHKNGSLHIRQNVTISVCPLRIGGCVRQNGKLVLHIRYTGESSVRLYRGQK